jgi:predicted DNA-binding protein with PD1-like motif
MKYKLLDDEGGLATYAVIMDEGDEAFSELMRFARETGVDGASLSGVGAASSVVVGWFDFEAKRYVRNAIAEQVEVVSLLGDIATAPDGQPQVHAHMVVAKRDATAHGGHLMELRVKPTLEIVVAETATHLRKRAIPGMALIDLDAS